MTLDIVILVCNRYEIGRFEEVTSHIKTREWLKPYLNNIIIVNNSDIRCIEPEGTVLINVGYNSGAMRGRLFGLDKSTADYIWFMDGDDDINIKFDGDIDFINKGKDFYQFACRWNEQNFSLKGLTFWIWDKFFNRERLIEILKPYTDKYKEQQFNLCEDLFVINLMAQKHYTYEIHNIVLYYNLPLRPLSDDGKKLTLNEQTEIYIERLKVFINMWNEFIKQKFVYNEFTDNLGSANGGPYDLAFLFGYIIQKMDFMECEKAEDIPKAIYNLMSTSKKVCPQVGYNVFNANYLIMEWIQKKEGKLPLDFAFKYEKAFDLAQKYGEEMNGKG